jgi:hypothetical protein
MRKAIYVIFGVWVLAMVVLLTGCCGPKGSTGAAGASVIGPRGNTGSTGNDGKDGHSTLFGIEGAGAGLCPTGGNILTVGLDVNDNKSLDLSEVLAVAVTCNGLKGDTGAAGHDGTNGTNGQDGSNGSNGVAGNNGTNGTNGVDGKDGVNGIDGTNAPPTMFTPVGLVQPCAADPMNPTAAELNDVNLEVFIRLSNGLLVGSFSDTAAGANTRFEVIPPGTWASTGHTACNFTVDSNNVVTH